LISMGPSIRIYRWRGDRRTDPGGCACLHVAGRALSRAGRGPGSAPAPVVAVGPVVGRCEECYEEPMPPGIVADLDFSKWDEPEPTTDLRRCLEQWLRYQRHEFIRKLRDLTPEGLVRWSVPPLELSVLGLVRHMTQMEHVYLGWGLGGGKRNLIYGDDDYAGGTVATVEADLSAYLAEIERADRAIAAIPSLESPGTGHGRPLAASLVKMIDEYALHSGQAHMLRFAALGEIVR